MGSHERICSRLSAACIGGLLSLALLATAGCSKSGPTFTASYLMDGKNLRVVVKGDRFRLEESVGSRLRRIQVYDGKEMHDQRLSGDGSVSQQRSEVTPSKGPGITRFWSALWIDEFFNTTELGPGDPVLGRETLKYKVCTSMVPGGACVTDLVDKELKIALKRVGGTPFECTELSAGVADETAFTRPW